MIEYYFEWQKNVYGASYNNTIILLRTKINDYAGLSIESSIYLKYILSKKFNKTSDLFITEEITNEKSKINPYKLNKYIEHFTNQKIISPTTFSDRRCNISYPLKSTGLSKREWFSYSESVVLDKTLIIRCFFYLCVTHFILRFYKLKGILDYLSKHCKPKNLVSCTIEYSLKLAKALEYASIFYPKKSECLPYASTLAILHYNQGYKCNFIIGVQNLPFYAHAWVENGKNVVNDNPELKVRLAPIYKISS